VTISWTDKRRAVAASFENVEVALLFCEVVKKKFWSLGWQCEFVAGAF
jgi:hypothetical protein